MTRKLATTVRGLHPMVVLFDECHELFEHRAYAGEAGPLAIRTVKTARKCGITMLFLTQSPTAASIPKDLTRNCSNGVAFAVADQVANDGLLGSGSYRQGIRATELRPGEDRGTAVTTGLTANRFELVSTFYIPLEEDRDEVTPVVARAMSVLPEAGQKTPTTDRPKHEVAQPADHLADIHKVMRGESRVRTHLVLRRLAELNPAEYDDWTFGDLAAALADYDLRSGKYQGNKVVRAEDVSGALTERGRGEEDNLEM